MFVFTSFSGRPKEHFHRSGLYFSLFQGPCQAMCPRAIFRAAAGDRCSKIRAPACRVLWSLSAGTYAASTADHCPPAGHELRVPSSLSGSLAASTHVPDRILQKRLDHLKWLEHKANQIRELNVQVRHVLCSRVRAVARRHSFGLQHFFLHLSGAPGRM